jgi:hypothetical protein
MKVVLGAIGIFFLAIGCLLTATADAFAWEKGNWIGVGLVFILLAYSLADVAVAEPHL